MKDIIDQLNWRYAVKEFDSRKLLREQVDMLLDSARLSASSFGLQPWKLILVENTDIRAKLVEYSKGQTKVRDASHLVVFTRLKKLDDAYVDKYISHIAQTRQVSIESLSGYESSIKTRINGMTQPEKEIYMTQQVYLAMGTFLTAAAMAGIDACPMGGFIPEKYDEILALDQLGVTSVILAAIGYRAQDDPQLKRKKVRFPREEVVTVI